MFNHVILGKRHKWNEQQRSIMLQYFKDNIKSKKALKKKDCLIFKQKFSEFGLINWIKIKTFIYNASKDK